MVRPFIWLPPPSQEDVVAEELNRALHPSIWRIIGENVACFVCIVGVMTIPFWFMLLLAWLNHVYGGAR